MHTIVKTTVLVALLAMPRIAAATTLLVPYFEVSSIETSERTTVFAVHNSLPDTAVVRISYFDRSSNLLRRDELALPGHGSRTVDVRAAGADLVPEADGIARGWVLVEGADGGVVENQLWGDWYIIIDTGRAVSGDQLTRPEDLCTKLEIRLRDVGSDVRLGWLATDPQGRESRTPTATFAVRDDEGEVVETRQVFTDDTVDALSLSDIFETRSGVLTIDFGAGAGAAFTETAGRHVTAFRNAVCVAG